MKNWPSTHIERKQKGDTGAFFYKKHAYAALGL
jgi:hypothetical protein